MADAHSPLEPPLETENEETVVSPANGAWRLRFDSRRGAAVESFVPSGHTESLLRSEFSVDDVSDRAALPFRSREFRKAGTAVVSAAAVLPVGHEIEIQRTWRIAANHARCTVDLKWPRQAPVKRHLWLDTLTIPGRWRRVFCVPPVQHVLEGAEPFERAIPADAEAPLMVAHWHRPPLAIVLCNDAGLELEIGTGDDVWRWEKSLGFGPESGSYKLFATPEGLQFVREPLMCCEEFTPAARQFRFTWHLAWTLPDDAASANTQTPETILDCLALNLPDTARRTTDLRGVPPAPDAPACLEVSAVQKALRSSVRKIANSATVRENGLAVHGVTPGLCLAGSHVDRPGQPVVPHWDLHALLAFSEWSRQQLGPECPVIFNPRGWAARLPSIRGAFGPNGF